MGPVAAIVGGIGGAIISSNATKKAARISAAASAKASEAAQQGFYYLRDNPLNQQAQAYGGQAMGLRNALLGIPGTGAPTIDQAVAEDAFRRFQESTGYQFRLGEGLGAINQNAAASGLMNSGATAKALTAYGQNMGSAEFGNYLGYLGGVEQSGLQAAANVASQGQSSGQAVAGIMANQGNTAAALQMQRARDITSGLGMAVSGVQDWWNSR